MARRAGGGKYCVEGCRFVDALNLRRKGYLQPPAPGKPPYAITANCGGREQHIATAWTPCRFGGKRLWFQCGYCARRVLRLYVIGGVFACRHCHRLGHSTAPQVRRRPIFPNTAWPRIVWGLIWGAKTKLRTNNPYKSIYY